MSEPSVVSPFAFTQLDAPPTVMQVGDALAAARREADGVREQARAAGHAEGYAAGLAEARTQAAPLVAALRAAQEEVAAAREHLLADTERDAVELAMALAEQVVAAAIEVQPERVLDVARHALRHLADRRRVTLIVNPEDLAVLMDAADGFTAELGGIEHIAVQADRRVGRGGAIAHTEAGEIDAGLTDQLEHAREIVAKALTEDA